VEKSFLNNQKRKKVEKIIQIFEFKVLFFSLLISSLQASMHFMAS